MRRYLPLLLFIGLAWGLEYKSNKVIVINDSLSISYEDLKGVLNLKLVANNTPDFKIGIENLNRDFLVVNKPKSGSQISWIRGKMILQKTLEFRLIPRNINKIIIPSLEINLNEQLIETEPFEITDYQISEISKLIKNKILFLSSGTAYCTDLGGNNYTFPYFSGIGMPYWVPDGLDILYNTRGSINIITTQSLFEGSNKTKVLHKDDLCLNPVINTERTKIYYEYDGTIIEYDIINEKRRELTSSPTEDYYPAISPDDKYLCWLSSGGIQLFDIENYREIKFFNGCENNIDSPSCFSGRPRWSQDSKTIVTSNKNGIILVNVINNQRKQLTNDNGQLPVFSAGGDTIVYIASYNSKNFPRYPNKHLRKVSIDGGNSKILYYLKNADIDYAVISPYY